MKHTVTYHGPGGQAVVDGVVLPKGHSLVLELSERRAEYLRSLGKYEIEPIFVPKPVLPYPGPESDNEEED